MTDKIARLGIERDTDLMYYIKPDGNVWATPRKKPGQPKGKARKIADTGLDLDYSRYIYFLDKDGDVARKERAGSGNKRAKTAPATPKAKAPAKAGGRGKSKAQLDADIEACVAEKQKARSSAHTRKRR
jgi:hypothetical protein